jgi:hypothetical protein
VPPRRAEDFLIAEASIMSANSMWGDLDEFANIKTPKMVLEEQARLLTEATGSVLQGEVDVDPLGTSFVITLNVLAPALGRHRYALLRVQHDLNLYPLEVKDNIQNASHTCESEEGFLSVLEKILSSAEVRKILGTLISQSRS